MAKFFAIACIMLAAGYIYIRQSAEHRRSDGVAPDRAAPAHNAAATADGVSSFLGNSGYLMELPDDYDAAPAIKDGREIVHFYPKGAEPTLDETLFKERRVVRLEVNPMKIGDRKLTLDIVKKGVVMTLEQNKEAFSVKDLNLGLPGFQVDITTPMELKQVFLEGASTLYTLTGNDEALMHRLGGSIKETGGR